MTENETASSIQLNQKQKGPLPQKSPVTTQHTSSGNPGKKESRNAKRRRWAKVNKPKTAPKQSVRSAPVFEYTSDCCKLPARKPRAGQKVDEKNPESGKTEKSSKGLGKWTCSGCQKKCKVTRQKPKTEVPNGSEVKTDN